MSGFLYFVGDGESREGLAYALEGASVSEAGCAGGPGGVAGTVLHCVGAGQEGRPGYWPEDQRWERWGERWIGLYEGDRPGPGDLVRARVCGGHWVELGPASFGGAELRRDKWLVPAVVAFPDRGSRLPQRVGLRDGAVIMELLPEYEELRKRCDAMFDAQISGKEPGFSWRDAAELAALGLGVNYRVGAGECLLAGWFTTENLREVLQAMIDLPNWMAGVASGNG